MLLTTCPNCGAKFKVAPEQLNVRQGRVMCGRCRHVFNAFEALKRIEDTDAGELVDYSLIVPSAADDANVSDDREVDTPNRSAGASEKPNHVEPIAASPVKDLRRDLRALGADRNDASLYQSPEAGRVQSDDTTVPQPSLESAASTVAAAAVNPLISGTLPRPTPPSRAWPWLAVVAGLALAIQAIYFFRSQIVQQYPQSRPSLAAACEAIGCTVSWGRDQSLIKIESSDLIEPPGRPGKILLTATLANRAATKQDFPALEVKLTDVNNGVLASRVLMPPEYLGRTPSSEEGLAPNVELYINLNLELAGKSPASGYGLRAFYP